MNSSMSLLRALIIDAIEQISPDVSPDITFRRAPMNCPLVDQTFGDAFDGTRRFHVIPGIIAGFQGPTDLEDWNGSTMQMVDTFEVQVRYESSNSDEAYGWLCDIVATDMQIIIHGIAPQTFDYGSTAILHRLAPTGTVEITPLEKNTERSSWIVKALFRLVTSLGSS